MAKHSKHSISETKHTYTILFKGPTLSSWYVTLYVEAGSWQQSKLNLSTSRRQYPLGAVGGSSVCTARAFQPGHCFGSQVQEVNVSHPHAHISCIYTYHAHIPNKCPSSRCHHRTKMYSFPWSFSLWLVFQYEGCRLKTSTMIKHMWLNTRAFVLDIQMEKLKILIVSEAVQQSNSCSMHDNSYYCYHNFSYVSLPESAGLVNFSHILSQDCSVLKSSTFISVSVNLVNQCLFS